MVLARASAVCCLSTALGRRPARTSISRPARCCPGANRDPDDDGGRVGHQGCFVTPRPPLTAVAPPHFAGVIIQRLGYITTRGSGGSGIALLLARFEITRDTAKGSIRATEFDFP